MAKILFIGGTEDCKIREIPECFVDFYVPDGLDRQTYRRYQWMDQGKIVEFMSCLPINTDFRDAILNSKDRKAAFLRHISNVINGNYAAQ